MVKKVFSYLLKIHGWHLLLHLASPVLGPDPVLGESSVDGGLVEGAIHEPVAFVHALMSVTPGDVNVGVRGLKRRREIGEDK